MEQGLLGISLVVAANPGRSIASEPRSRTRGGGREEMTWKQSRTGYVAESARNRTRPEAIS